jgi:hypothetical protein
MNGERLLLDSVILIDHLNGIDRATAYVRSVLDASQISAITRAEVLAGLARGDLSLGKTFLDRFPLIPIDGPVADLAAELRRRFRWRLPDALQAAVARHHGLLLVTRNTKDFPPRPHRFVRVPYEL